MHIITFLSEIISQLLCRVLSCSFVAYFHLWMKSFKTGSITAQAQREEFPLGEILLNSILAVSEENVCR